MHMEEDEADWSDGTLESNDAQMEEATPLDLADREQMSEDDVQTNLPVTAPQTASLSDQYAPSGTSSSICHQASLLPATEQELQLQVEKLYDDLSPIFRRDGGLLAPCGGKASFMHSLVLVVTLHELGWRHHICDNSESLTAFVVAHAKDSSRFARDVDSWPKVVQGLDSLMPYKMYQPDLVCLITPFHLETMITIMTGVKECQPNTNLCRIWLNLRSAIRKTELDLWCAYSSTHPDDLPELAWDDTLPSFHGKVFGLPFNIHQDLWIGGESVVVQHTGDAVGYCFSWRGVPAHWRPEPSHLSATARADERLRTTRENPTQIQEGRQKVPPRKYPISQDDGRLTQRRSTMRALMFDNEGFDHQGNLSCGTSYNSGTMLMQIALITHSPVPLLHVNGPGYCQVEFGATPDMCEVMEVRTLRQKVKLRRLKRPATVGISGQALRSHLWKVSKGPWTS